MRRGERRRDHVLRGELPDSLDGDPLLAGRVEGRRGSRDGGRRGLRKIKSSLLYVVARHRAHRTGAGDAGEVDAEVPRQFAHRRLGQDRTAPMPVRRGDRGGTCLGRKAGRLCRRGRGDHGDGGHGRSSLAWLSRVNRRRRCGCGPGWRTDPGSSLGRCGFRAVTHQDGRAAARSRTTDEAGLDRPLGRRDLDRRQRLGRRHRSGEVRWRPADGSVSMATIGEPTSTVVPASWKILVTTPAHFAGISTAALAVSTSTIGWFSSIVSPTLTSQDEDLALGQALAEVGQAEFLDPRHPPHQPNERSTASSTRSRSGRYSSSTRAAG